MEDKVVPGSHFLDINSESACFKVARLNYYNVGTYSCGGSGMV